MQARAAAVVNRLSSESSQAVASLAGARTVLERSQALLDAANASVSQMTARYRAGLTSLTEDETRELNRVWHRGRPWPDSVPGLTRLKTRFTIAPMSNGNLSLLTNMAKRAGLPWDCVLSAEVFRAYKPDPATYLGVASTFDLQPHQVMLCAAHHDDLEGARACGLRTAYIERPFEFGASQPKDVSPQAGNDLHARDIHALADLLGC